MSQINELIESYSVKKTKTTKMLHTAKKYGLAKVTICSKDKGKKHVLDEVVL